MIKKLAALGIAAAIVFAPVASFAQAASTDTTAAPAAEMAKKPMAHKKMAKKPMAHKSMHKKMHKKMDKKMEKKMDAPAADAPKS